MKEIQASNEEMLRDYLKKHLEGLDCHNAMVIAHNFNVSHTRAREIFNEINKQAA